MRDILVHATEMNAWMGAIPYAAHLAAFCKASLTALYCNGDADRASAAPSTVAISEEVNAVAARFRAFAGSLGVAHMTWVEHRGDPAQAVAHLSHWHDMLILGRGSGSAWETDTAQATLLMASSLPCIIVPGAADLTPFRPMRIAVAWNGSLQAVRALHASVALLEKAHEVVLIMGGDTGSQYVRHGYPDFDIDAYLERHGIDARRVTLDASRDPPGKAILQTAITMQAELLVMGAFGHARLLERLLGGTTQSVLLEASIPVLLRH